MKFYTAKRFMTKDEILQELQSFAETYLIDKKHIIITGDAAMILSNIEPNITYDTDTKQKNIDILAAPKYYDYLIKSEDIIEDPFTEDHVTSFSYEYCTYNGYIRLIRMKCDRPKCKMLYGFNVQCYDAGNKPRSTVTNFRVVK